MNYYYNSTWHELDESYVEEKKVIFGNLYMWLKTDLPVHVLICPYWKIDNVLYSTDLASSAGGYIKLTEYMGDEFK